MSDTAGGVQDPARATQPKRAEQSLGELFTEMTRELSELFRKEVQLAKVEAREEVSTSAKAMGAMVGAAVAALLVLALASVALVGLLDEAMPRALAFLVVAALWAIVAAVLLSVGRSRLKQVRPLPETTETIKEDVQWAKTLKR